jgi:hypothetical protein
MKVSDAFPSNYLKAADLQRRKVSVRIKSIATEEVGSEHKLVIYFEGKEKGMILNKTNAMTLAYAFGDETDNWAGATIELYPTMTSFQGKPVEAIRINAMPGPATNGNAASHPTASSFAAPDDRFVPNAATGRHVDMSGPMDDEIPFSPEFR